MTWKRRDATAQEHSATPNRAKKLRRKNSRSSCLRKYQRIRNEGPVSDKATCPRGTSRNIPLAGRSSPKPVRSVTSNPERRHGCRTARDSFGWSRSHFPDRTAAFPLHHPPSQLLQGIKRSAPDDAAASQRQERRP